MANSKVVKSAHAEHRVTVQEGDVRLVVVGPKCRMYLGIYQDGKDALTVDVSSRLVRKALIKALGPRPSDRRIPRVTR